MNDIGVDKRRRALKEMSAKETAERKNNDARRQAPDGGWGWFVCVGSSLISISLRSLDPSFGLLFHDLLVDLNVGSTGTSIIMSVLDAIINFSGFTIGPLLKKYSYRQVALFGSLLSCSGLILTSRAGSMLYLICTYSVLGGVGTGLAIASSFVALNTFFDKKRGQAVGFSMAGTAFGMVLMPQLIHLLLNEYGFRGTTLIVGGWALHSVMGSCLLRPLKILSPIQPEEKKSDEEREDKALLTEKSKIAGRRSSNGSFWTNEQDATTFESSSKPKNKSFAKKLMETLDLDLLKDFTYLIISLGCALFYVAESNFKLMAPFFLSDIGMTKREVAFCLSLTAFADIIARLLLPTLFDWIGWRKRVIFWIFGAIFGVARSVLAEQSGRVPLMVMFVVAGFLRGATLVNLNLSISEYVTLKKLPSAFGMFMVFKGLLVVTMSPLIGYIRDVSGSYKICIHVMTAMMMTTTIVWAIELLYTTLHRRRHAIIKKLQMHILAVLPMQQCFGLIFAERFADLGITATQTSLILHLNGTIACSLGLISSPMMKRFSFRKVACFGGLTVVLGICTAAFAMSLPTLIVTYCVIIGIGQGIIFPATSLAMNTYFRRKRNIAMGFSVTMTGLGPILMPLLIDVLLENYATTGSLLLLAGIATHSLVGASLLEPFKEREKQVISTGEAMDISRKQNGIETTNSEKEAEEKEGLKNNSVQCRLLNEENVSEERSCDLRKNKEQLEESASMLRKIAKNLDLDLLRDKRYLAIVLGMGISLVAETNFNAMIPFVLAELASLDRTSIATVMSIQAAADITGRLCVPLLAQKIGWTCRNLYVMSLLGSILGRTILSTWGDIYVVVIMVSLIVGLAKGTKAVFQALIIPDYVPLERLPAASGIQMVCNGILSISVGPIIGVVHDVRNSYVGALYFMSLLSMSCVFLWLISGLWTSCGKLLRSPRRSLSAERENSCVTV
ncbi:uncharacterized protein LOC116840954 [Odontomachus brunneus]|uniref:uncharacterized protein LOC116840954 n=1 Tax=Odontomachus brunneus TaxID=486640 RepID=UPI0013F1D07E|nr:uncharacterized protein LOC116840954 [Odontomachus brunneus]